MAQPLHPARRTVTDRLHSLGPGQRTALYLTAGVIGLTLPCCGGLTAIGAVVGDPKPRQSATVERRAAVESASRRSPASAKRSNSPSPSTTASPSPRIETRQVTEEQSIPFTTDNVNDPNLAQGTTEVRTAGVPGVKTITYEVTYTDGVQTGKKQLTEAVTRPPVAQVVAVGTRQEPKCDPNYSGACVPIASDVDCAGGSGNGPAYVRGPVKVIGTDIYDLDRDGDGWGCE